MIRKIVVLAVVAASAFALGAGAAPKGKPTAAPSAGKEAKVRQMLMATGAADMGNQMLESMISEVEKQPDTPAGFIPRFRELAKQDDLVSHIVPIYARYLSDADLDGILAFYNSKAGQDLAKAQPMIFKEAQEEGQRWGESLAKRALDDVDPDKKVPR